MRQKDLEVPDEEELEAAIEPRPFIDSNAVDCPSCDAKAGFACISDKGEVLNHYHVSRWRQANKK